MRVDRVIVDTLRSLRQALQTLDNNITVQDNFGPSGVDDGWIIVSIGRLRVPVWKKASDVIGSAVSSGNVIGLKGDKGDSGADGNDGVDGVALGDWEQLVFVTDPVDPPEDLWAYKADGNPDIVQGWRNY